MIEKIILANFKGIGDEAVTILLGNLTLLFGGNSAGKSTVLHALAYAKEIFTRHNCDADKTMLGGDSLDLGGFKEMVHGHQVTKRIQMRFDFPYKCPPSFRSKNDIGIKKCWIRLEIGIPPEHSITQNDAPRVLTYEVGYDNELLAELIYCSDDAYRKGYNGYLRRLNRHHPAVSKEIRSFFDSLEIREDNATHLDPNGLFTHRKDALPLSKFSGMFFDGKAVRHDADRSGRQRKMIDELRTFIVHPSWELRHLLNSLCYIGPIRQIPERRFPFERSAANPLADAAQRDVSHWATGRGAYDALPHLDAKQWEQINQDLSGSEDDFLNTGYELVYKPYGLNITEEGLPTLPEAAYYPPKFLAYIGSVPKEEFLAFIPLEEWFGLFDINRKVLVQLSNVGAGLSQIIPLVICMAKHKGQTLLFEQPELHLHPKQQAAVGDLLIRAAKSGTPIIAETHSIHLIQRVLRRMRETFKKPSPSADSFGRDDLSVLYAQSENGTTDFWNIAVGKDGEFLDGWPDDFFVQEMKERYAS